MLAHIRFTQRVSLTSRLVFAGLALVCLTLSVNAGPGKAAKRESQLASNAQLGEGLQVLQTTKKMLQGADHDYGGHRVATIKAIGVAERQLTLALHSQPKRAAPGGKAQGKVGRPGGKAQGKVGRPGAGRGKQLEPQSMSNLQLADAIVMLERTRAVLEKADHDYGGHRIAAVRDLGGAIRQLKTALRFDKRAR